MQRVPVHSFRHAGVQTATCPRFLAARFRCVSRSASRLQKWENTVPGRGEPGLENLEGPLLADFLAMGAGSTVATSSKGNPLSSATQSSLTESQDAGSAGRTTREDANRLDIEERLTPVREKPVVVAALRRGEALTPALAEAELRTPVASERVLSHAKQEIPVLFSRASEEYLRSNSQSGAAVREKAEAAQDSHDATSEHPVTSQLRPQPWHRRELQKMLCKAILFHFLQYLRKTLSLRDGQTPLWSWEVRRAQEHAAAGQTILLVRYLTKTELHIEHGAVRREYMPGSVAATALSPSEISEGLLTERRQLSRTRRFSSAIDRALSEDALIRELLDGSLSWEQVRKMLQIAPLLPRAAKALQTGDGDSGFTEGTHPNVE
eukprot:TRINITY_DN61178_c0_g1_i1.p1 TRINITY_DN61178_c0_g1~~TRINITY_DN61178_c0_g1_i1.p1  ORF type:complete len:379 (+),score=66.56 TRINITY_DN61178_c0_g1_i1:2-1138(+)